MCARERASSRSIKRLDTHAYNQGDIRTIRTHTHSPNRVSFCDSSRFSSFFLYFCIYVFHWAVKNAALILLIAVHFVVTHEQKKWHLLSVWKHSWNGMSSSHSDQVIKMIVKFISASATTIIIYFLSLSILWTRRKFDEKKNGSQPHLNSREEKRNGSIRIVAVASGGER